MNQKILISAVIVLAMLNVATLSFIWINHPQNRPFGDRMPHPNVERFLKRRLNLTPEQLEAFHAARKQHFKNVHELRHSLHEDRRRLTKILYENDTTGQHALLTTMGAKRTEMEKLNFRHLKHLRSLCSADQKPVFDSVIDKMMDRMMDFDDRRGRRRFKKRD